MPCPRGGRDDYVGQRSEQRSLDGVRKFIGELDGAHIFRAKGRELFNRLEDLVGQFAGRYKDQGGGSRLGVSLA